MYVRTIFPTLSDSIQTVSIAAAAWGNMAAHNYTRQLTSLARPFSVTRLALAQCTLRITRRSSQLYHYISFLKCAATNNTMQMHFVFASIF